MTRSPVICALASFLICSTVCAHGSKYYRAAHGFNGGMTSMIDLSEFEEFNDARTLDDVARLASQVPGAVGFTAHPDFADGTRYASAVLWYTKLSPTSDSWGLYLFDEAEAKKKPGAAPRAEAVAAAEARALIDTSGPEGVELSGEHEEKKVQ